MKKINVIEKNEKIDYETGEIKESITKLQYKIPQEEDYVKIYLKHINYLNNLPQGLDSIIYELLKYVSYSNKIVINSSIKRQISNSIGKSFNTVNQYITNLVKHEILLREDVGMYILNPCFYGKGRWEDILKLRKEINISISYKENQYTITHNLKEEENKEVEEDNKIKLEKIKAAS